MSINGVLTFDKTNTTLEAYRGRSYTIYDQNLCAHLNQALAFVYQEKYIDAFNHFKNGLSTYFDQLLKEEFNFNNLMIKFNNHIEAIEAIIFEITARTDRFPTNFGKYLWPLNEYMSRANHWVQKNPNLSRKEKEEFLILFLKRSLTILELDFDMGFLEVYCGEFLYLYDELSEQSKKRYTGIKDRLLNKLTKIAIKKGEFKTAYAYARLIEEDNFLVVTDLHQLAVCLHIQNEYALAYACASQALITINKTQRKFDDNKLDLYTKGELMQTMFNTISIFKPNLEAIRRKCFNSNKDILTDFLKSKDIKFNIKVKDDCLDIMTEIAGCENALEKILSKECDQCSLSFKKKSITIHKFSNLTLSALMQVVEFINIKELQLKKSLAIAQKTAKPFAESVVPVKPGSTDMESLYEPFSSLTITAGPIDYQKEAKQKAAQMLQKQELKNEKKRQKNTNSIDNTTNQDDSSVEKIIASDAKLLGFSPDFGNSTFHLCRKFTKNRNIYVVRGENLTGEVPSGADLAQFDARFDNAAIVPKRGKSGFKWMKNPPGVEPAYYLVGKVVTQKLRLQPSFYQVNDKGDVAYYYGNFVNTKNGLWKKDFVKNGMPIRKIK